MKGVISVGSHYGEEYELWLSMGAIYFAFFEPIEANYQKLIRLLGNKPNVKTFPYAIGNFSGKTTMYVETEHSGKSCSVLKPLKHLEQYPDIIFDRKQVVNIEPLDTFFFEPEKYDYLHVDTQGYELEVLKGADKTLDHINEIHIEVYKEELYEGCAMFEDIDKFLKNKGFDLDNVVWRGYTWGDAKYIRL